MIRRSPAEFGQLLPGVIDLSDIAAAADSGAQIVLGAIQEMLLKLALQMARDDCMTRRERQRQDVQIARAAGKAANPEVNALIPRVKGLLNIEQSGRIAFTDDILNSAKRITGPIGS